MSVTLLPSVAAPLSITRAEGQAMKPEDFLDNIVTTNVVHLSQNRGDMRCAVNALLTSRRVRGDLVCALDQAKHPSKGDIEFRDLLSDECLSFRIVRDTAFALKHGELTAKKPRLFQEQSK
jgi:hypothetical protein